MKQDPLQESTQKPFYAPRPPRAPFNRVVRAGAARSVSSANHAKARSARVSIRNIRACSSSTPSAHSRSAVTAWSCSIGNFARDRRHSTRTKGDCIVGMFNEVVFEAACPDCKAIVGGFQTQDDLNDVLALTTVGPDSVRNFYSECKCGAWLEFDMVPPVNPQWTLSVGMKIGKNPNVATHGPKPLDEFAAPKNA